MGMGSESKRGGGEGGGGQREPAGGRYSEVTCPHAPYPHSVRAVNKHVARRPLTKVLNTVHMEIPLAYSQFADLKGKIIHKKTCGKGGGA